MEASLLDIQPQGTLVLVKDNVSSNPCCYIELKNHHEYVVAYKLMTTDPSKYVVRPAHSVVWAGSETKVKVTNQKPGEKDVTKDRLKLVAY